jgi:hypothetical protein
VAAVELERAVDELLQRPHAAPGPRRVRVQHPADARGRVRRSRQGRPRRPARLPGPLVRTRDRDGARATTAPAGSASARASGTRSSATHAECAVELADAVRLRPDARPGTWRRSASPR